MSSQDCAIDDDHVALLLAKEAKEASKKYSELGVMALLPTRPTTAAPKPNTRFLKNIIRETDNHNHALKKKEGLEARLRLRAVNNGVSTSLDTHELDDERRRKRRRVKQESHGREQRQRKESRLHDEDSSEGYSGNEEEDGRRLRRGEYGRDKDRNGYRRRRDTQHHDEEQPGTSRRETRPSRLQELIDKDERSRGHPRKKQRRFSSEGLDLSGELGHHHRRWNDRGYQSRRERRLPDSEQSRHPRCENGPRMSRTSSDTDIRNAMSRKNRTTLTANSESDSDPLEALVGPLPPTSNLTSANDPPPLRSRGRGAYKTSSSAMDQHFTSTYNPNLDLHPDSELEDEKEDWDMALEALRDREIWKQKGAERLRAAGFGDAEIKKWEDSGKEKGVEDVKWTGKGEAREWDRGKVVDEVGERKSEVGLEAAWKRKGAGFLRDFKKALG